MAKPSKSYTNFNEEATDTFDKTIYRSDVISDESLVNGFRHFGANEYKNILEYDGCLNLMKGAIVLCDKLSTVSPTYANEIKYDFYSHGLSAITEEFAYKTTGILNGIDYSVFDTKKDKLQKKHAAIDGATPTNFKDAYEKIVALKEIKSSIEALLESDPDNTELKGLLVNVNSTITNYTNNANSVLRISITDFLLNYINSLQGEQILNSIKQY